MYGAADLIHDAPSRKRRPPVALDRRPIASNLELPLYVREGVERYMLAHEDTTFRTVLMEGLDALGIEIEAEDLIPERAMRKLRQRVPLPDDTPDTLKPTSIKLPRYVRQRADAYLQERPDMRFRHLVMAGFKALGIDVKDADLIAERTNVLAEAPLTSDG
jgi:hypothetical protein